MGGSSQRRPVVVLTATVAAAMLVVANVAVLNVALPALAVELEASQAQSQWMVDIYAVALASLLLPVGAIGDRFGRRLILLLGLAIVLAASVVTIFLDTANQVIAARAVSGIGAAFVFPATLSTITSVLPQNQRSKGVAIWTAAVSAGGFLGILASGVLIENFWWGSLFLGMAIATAVVFVLCLFGVPDSSDPAEANLDPVGGVLSAVAFGALVLGIIEGPVKGWTATLSLAGLIVGAVSLLAFVAWELYTPRPLLDVRLFAQRGVRAGSLSVFTQFVGAFGIFFLVVFYLGVFLGYGPLDIGLSLIPISIGLVPASLVAIPLAARIGRRAVGTVGILTMGAGFAYGATIGVDGGLREFLTSVMIMGVGYGLAGPPATEAIVESLPPAQQGVASALNDVLRELGTAIGIAVAGSAFNSAYRSEISSLTGYPDEVTEAVRESPFAVAQLAPTLGDGAASLVADVQRAALEGWSAGLWTLSAAMGVGALGFMLWAPPRVVPAAEPSGIPLGAPGPLGAMELGSAAESDLRAVADCLAETEQRLEQLVRQSAVPAEMTTWSATEQVEVAERATIAIAPSLDRLAAGNERLTALVRACDANVLGASAELVRLGREPQALAEMHRLVDDVLARATHIVTRSAQLAERFGELGDLFSTLRPTQRHLTASHQALVANLVIMQGWLDARPAVASSLDLRDAPGDASQQIH